MMLLLCATGFTAVDARTDELDELLGSSAAAQEETEEPEGAAEEGGKVVTAGDMSQPAAQGQPAVEPYQDTIAVPDSGAQPPQALREKPRGRVRIEEIVVTAQKREENIQDVPISIQAFSGSELEAKGVTDASKLQNLSSGLIFNQVAGYAVIYIRGVGTDAFIPSADLSIATYVDGVYFPFSVTLAKALGTLERIEVLKGPQGTLFGRNSTGGAISIVTRDPGPEYTGSVTASYGRYEDLQSKAYLAGPLSDTVSGSVSVLYNHKKDYYEHAPESPRYGEDLQQYQDKGANIKLKWEPSEWFDAKIDGYAFESRGVGTFMFDQDAPSPLIGGLLGLQSGEDYKVYSDQYQRGAFETQTAALTVNLRPEWFDLKSITSYQEFGADGLGDFDGTGKNVASFSSQPADSPRSREFPQYGRAATQEFQLLSTPGGLGPDWLTYILGFYYINSSAGFQPATFRVSGLNDLLSGSALQILDNPLLNSVAALIGGIGLPQVGANISIYGSLDTESTATFAQFAVHPTDELSVTIGGRYQQETRRVYGAHTDLTLLPDGQPIVLFPVSGNEHPEQTIDQDNFSPRVALQWHPSDTFNVYGSYSKGFKSGSFNIVNMTTPPGEIRPEEVTALELGFKSMLFSNRLRLNAAVFRNSIKDLQVQVISLLSGGVTSFENAGEATIDGFEVEANWAITDNLILGLNGSYLDSRYDSYAPASGFDPDRGGLYSASMDFTGNRIVRTPEYSGAVTLNYALAAPGGTFEIAGDLYYNDGFFYDAGNTVAQARYTLFGGQLSYLHERSDVRVTLFGENLTNERYYTYRLPIDFGVLARLAPPRGYGVRLGWEF
ncbi:TonB-dependent receptor [Sinimarinibacterium flocculans]|uniref:TonB-dependent receptor n=1 Tax=Sinimarinibacterium flocculans TaxID=985250 RepID=UPI002490CE78|nr:TonB-dependent receptor [Sinimarinibacterium flocculans]